VGVDRRFDRTPAKTARARRLRHEMTDMERKLWGHLRADQMEGIGFRRQHPVAVRDNERTAFLAARGIAVLRFWNIDVMENLDGVLEMIRGSVIARGRDRAGAASTPTPTLPLSGGGSDRKADR
jgi:very-short-patch-repair endonuclease